MHAATSTIVCIHVNIFQAETENLAKLVTNMKSFVSNVSSYEGAEIPGTCSLEDDDFAFDPNMFMDSLRGKHPKKNILRKKHDMSLILIYLVSSH